MFDASEYTVLIVGDVMLDQYWQGECKRISPEAPVPVVAVADSIDRAGGAANVALNAHALGAHVILLGVVGNDEASRSLQHILEDHGVICHFLVDSEKPTIKKLRVIEGHNHQMIRMDFESLFDEHPQLLDRFCAQVAQADVVVFSDYNKGTIGNVQSLITEAKKHNKRVIVDPKGTDFSRYAGADVVTPNKHELAAVIGQSANQEHMTHNTRALLAQHKIDNMLITLGEKGMLLVNQTTIHAIASQAREVADVTGAGDTVVATLACMWHGETQLADAMHIANVAAGIAVGKSGASVTSVAEIQQALQYSRAKKIYNQTELASTIQRTRVHNKPIVLTNGCFDLLHVGHVNYLHEAKALGDILIVAVNADETVTALKGAGRPIQPLAVRMEMLAALEVVDYVVAFVEPTPHAIISLLKPDVLVKGGDYASEEEIVGAELVTAYQGTVKVLGHIQDYSTSATIAKILSIHR